MCPESWWALPPTFKRGKILKTFFTQIHMHERNQGHHKWVLLSKFQYWACLIYYVQEKKNISLYAWCNKVFVTVWGKNCYFKTYLEYFSSSRIFQQKYGVAFEIDLPFINNLFLNEISPQNTPSIYFAIKKWSYTY